MEPAEVREWRIPLPYERPPLNLNDRHHWATKGRITAEIRVTAGIVLRSHKVPALVNAEVQLFWFVPDRRRRDTDNTVATLKPIADAMVDVGIFPDDTPEFVSKKETEIIYEKGRKSLWLVIKGEVA